MQKTAPNPLIIKNDRKNLSTDLNKPLDSFFQPRYYARGLSVVVGPARERGRANKRQATKERSENGRPETVLSSAADLLSFLPRLTTSLLALDWAREEGLANTGSGTGREFWGLSETPPKSKNLLTIAN
jgi:hypothetical protein